MDGYVKQAAYDELKSSLDQKNEELSRLSASNERLQDEIAELKRLLFGKKSERFVDGPLPGQLLLDLEGAPAPEQPGNGCPATQ